MHNTFTTTAALPVQQSSQDIHIMMMHLFDEAKATLLHVKASSDLPTSPNQVIVICSASNQFCQSSRLARLRCRGSKL